MRLPCRPHVYQTRAPIAALLVNPSNLRYKDWFFGEIERRLIGSVYCIRLIYVQLVGRSAVSNHPCVLKYFMLIFITKHPNHRCQPERVTRIGIFYPKTNNLIGFFCLIFVRSSRKTTPIRRKCVSSIRTVLW